MIKRGLIIADRHLDATKEPHPAYLLVRKFAKELKPDFVVDLGDSLDLPYLGSFNRENLKLLSEHSFADDYDLFSSELDFWLQCTKKLTILQGNHDLRVERLAEKMPMFEGFLDYERAFELKKRGIPFYRLSDQPFRMGKLSLIHGWFYNVHHARKHLDVWGGNLCYGHCHVFQTASRVIPYHGEETQAWAIGSLSDVAPEYAKGRPMGHQNGFGVVYVDTRKGDFNLFPVNIIHEKFLFEGKEWGL